MKLETLYDAQNAGYASVETHIFPRYSEAFVGAQTGTKSWGIYIYHKVFTIVSLTLSPVGKVVNAIACEVHMIAAGIFDFCVPQKINDFLFPINEINGNRHFVGGSRQMEKKVGDGIYYLANRGLRSTNARLDNQETTISERLTTRMEGIIVPNKAILHSNKYDYRLKTVKSSILNAGAVTGGGMIYYTDIIQEVHDAISTRKYQEAEIPLGDGGTAVVDLSSVKLEDVEACLLGHEMTHVAARHMSIAKIALLITSAAIQVAFAYAMSNLICKNSKKAVELFGKKKFQSALVATILYTTKKIEIALSGFYRKNEYEADMTGDYLAHDAGFNPLGSIYLDEMFYQLDTLTWFQKRCEIFSTHPHPKNRMRAHLAAIGIFAPEVLEGKVTYKEPDVSKYDRTRPSPAIAFGEAVKNKYAKV